MFESRTSWQLTFYVFYEQEVCMKIDYGEIFEEFKVLISIAQGLGPKQSIYKKKLCRICKCLHMPMTTTLRTVMVIDQKTLPTIELRTHRPIGYSDAVSSAFHGVTDVA